MYLKKLLLKNFRKFTESQIEFSPSINCILGNNAAGKTTLLEAIIFLSTGKSFRTNQYSDLIQEGKEYLYLEGLLDNDGEESTIKVFFNGSQKKISQGGISFSTFSSLLSSFPSVLFTPLDMQLIDTSPACRRRFMNVQEMQINKDYRHHLYRFSKSLQQRNSALRSRNGLNAAPWESFLSDSGFYIMQKRNEMINELNSLMHQKTFESPYLEEFMLLYAPSFPIADSSSILQSLYEKTRERDVRNQTTGFGIHRDDLLFVQKNSPRHMKKFSSEGQKRTALFAIKLAEWNRLQSKMQTDPIFCLDDLSLHLDSERLAHFTHSLAQLKQVVITSPVPLVYQTSSMHCIKLDTNAGSDLSAFTRSREK